MNQNTTPTSEILNLAADLIEERGWTTGNGGRENFKTGPLCVEGAIGAALGLPAWSDDLSFFSQVVQLGCPAARAVHSYLGLASSDPLWTWNDDFDEDWNDLRSGTEVVEVLRAAAVIEAAKENADVRESVSS